MKIKNILFIILIALALSACQHKKNQKVTHKTVTVTAQASENVLHYAGVISPLAKVPIVTPEDGVVNEMTFQYGDRLKKDQLLYVIKSPKQHENFQTVLTDYLNAKQNLDTSRAKASSTYQLWKEGIVARDEMQGAQKEYYSSELTFLQSKAKLDQILELHRIEKFPRLTIADIKKINQLLDFYKKKIENIVLYAPNEGVALLPKEEKKSEVLIGSNVKEGDILLYVGDISGLSIAIDVNEIDINQLKEGQKVTVTSDALPKTILHGYIDHINTQALSAGGGSGSPIFEVKVIVPHITPAQRKLIHIGMSAEVSITLKYKPQILIPVGAVSRQNGKTVVNVVIKGTKKIKQVPVVTGTTTQNSVVIVSGLKSGDQVVIPHQAKTDNEDLSD